MKGSVEQLCQLELIEQKINDTCEIYQEVPAVFNNHPLNPPTLPPSQNKLQFP